MKYRDYVEQLQELSSFAAGKIDGFNVVEIFNPDIKPFIKDWSDQNNMPVPVRGDGVGDKSGLYFILSENGSVLYIGKATKSNLHERIWGHIQTPVEGVISGSMLFPNNRFKSEGESKHSPLVESGDVKIGIVEISPSIATSLVEVYLQTIFLPPLCKQIG